MEEDGIGIISTRDDEKDLVAFTSFVWKKYRLLA